MMLWPEIPRKVQSPMNGVVQLLAELAPRSAPITLVGPSGTGKEVLARAIHRNSKRANSPFVPINCGALPENLIEAELFGFKKGSFTGAHQDRIGKIAQAHGGTLFLDEIGELPLTAQTRLLRVLQERKVCPIGSAEEMSVDFRLLCATHRNLVQMSQIAQFREDLLYRIMVFPVVLPALAERVIDIPLLVHQLWHEIALDQGIEISDLNNQEMDFLSKHPWPGNIRQLRHALERYLVYRSLGKSLEEACDPLGQNSIVPNEMLVPLCSKYERERNRIRGILEQCRFNKSRTAEMLGMSRGMFLRYLKKIGLND